MSYCVKICIGIWIEFMYLIFGLGVTWQCSGLTTGSAFRDISQGTLWNTVYQNQDQPFTRQVFKCSIHHTISWLETVFNKEVDLIMVAILMFILSVHDQRIIFIFFYKKQCLPSSVQKALGPHQCLLTRPIVNTRYHPFYIWSSKNSRLRPSCWCPTGF